MSSAINGSAPFGPTLTAGAALLAVHWLFAQLAVRRPVSDVRAFTLTF